MQDSHPSASFNPLLVDKALFSESPILKNLQFLKYKILFDLPVQNLSLTILHNNR